MCLQDVFGLRLPILSMKHWFLTPFDNGFPGRGSPHPRGNLRFKIDWVCCTLEIFRGPVSRVWFPHPCNRLLLQLSVILGLKKVLSLSLSISLLMFMPLILPKNFHGDEPYWHHHTVKTMIILILWYLWLEQNVRFMIVRSVNISNSDKPTGTYLFI